MHSHNFSCGVRDFKALNPSLEPIKDLIPFIVYDIHTKMFLYKIAHFILLLMHNFFLIQFQQPPALNGEGHCVKLKSNEIR